MHATALQVDPRNANTGQIYTKHRSDTAHATISAIADTGCQSCLAGKNNLPKLGLKAADLIPVTTKMRSAGNDSITILGAIFLRISGTDTHGMVLTTHQMTYVSNHTSGFFLNRGACADLGIISVNFPTIGEAFHSTNSVAAAVEVVLWKVSPIFGKLTLMIPRSEHAPLLRKKPLVWFDT